MPTLRLDLTWSRTRWWLAVSAEGVRRMRASQEIWKDGCRNEKDAVFGIPKDILRRWLVVVRMTVVEVARSSQPGATLGRGSEICQRAELGGMRLRMVSGEGGEEETGPC